ncbi:Uu.00g075580.m01.CDS01 [Anthostomella pinea]|uniref:Uu.00g075580.m01.CDS01 n=1 Tax=Anthostomella pinea TaxID=933095 RepID=A0AAI8VVR1_9PEZI|nr:Uu.00g075580.m01.CDS01 [Anthostomella pinea]
MGNNTSLLQAAIEVIAPRKRTRSEEMENLKKPQKMLRTGSVTRSIQRRLGQAKEEKPEVPTRRTKSVDYLREPHPERWVSVNGGLGDDDSDTDSLRPRVPNPSMPQDDEKPAATSKATETLCDTCSGINIETVTDGAGYCHLLLSEIYDSGVNCDLCRSVSTLLNVNSNKRYTDDRYRILVSLELELGTLGSVQNSSGHYDSSSATWSGSSPSSLRFAIYDYRPWEEPDLQPFLHSWADPPLEYTVPEGADPEIVVSTTVPVLTDEHDIAMGSGVGWVRELGPNTASARSFDVAAGWLQSCLSCEPAPRQTTWGPRGKPRAVYPPVEIEHAWTLQEATAVSKSDTLLAEIPSRLIQICPDSEGNGMVRLVETRKIEATGEPVRFAALSYCWGQPEAGDDGARTTRKTLGSHLEGIPRSSLPKTIQDGIMVAEKLGIPYIWIDALCIVQDDADDWIRESAKMSGIYLGSVLTIAVASSVSADKGCFNSESQPTVKSAKFHEGWVTIEGTLKDGRKSRLYFSKYSGIVDDLDMYQHQVLESPLATRAWTLQEQVLPRRILYYTSKQLVWKCTHCIVNEENFPQKQHQELYPILDFDCPLVPEAIDELWYQGIVERYSKRHLTFGSDKLVAISALVRATYLNRHVDYVAGLWKDCILSGMLWRRDSVGHKNKTYSCPSWTWASQSSTVSYYWASGRTHDVSMFTPRVVDLQYKHGPASPFGDVLSAYIYLDTRIRLGTVTRDYIFAADSDRNRDGNISQSLVFSDAGSTKLWHAEAVMDDERAVGGSVAMAILLGRQAWKPVLLLLHPPDLGADQYRRVGIAQLGDYPGSGCPEYEADESVESAWKRRTIKLI